jgi:hypothetical protein
MKAATAVWRRSRLLERYQGKVTLGKLSTQIGGKFSKYNLGLFDLKRHLAHAGIEVSYPTGDTIVKTVNGVELSFDPESSLDFYSVEIEYLKCVRHSSFHTVCNIFQDHQGYVGKSAGMELAYAMLHSVPIVFLYKPSFQDSIDPAIRELLISKIHLAKILRLDLLSTRDLIRELQKISDEQIDYELSVESEIIVMANVQAVLDEYRT